MPNTDMQSSQWLKELANAKTIGIIAGAGLSAASGIPTFRGAGGLWRKYDAMSLGTPKAFAANPSRGWQFYHYRREKVQTCRPNAAHYALALLSDPTIRQKVAPSCEKFLYMTQNIDGLAQRAVHDVTADPQERKIALSGLRGIHGELFKVRCIKCKKEEFNYDSPICESLRGTEELVEETQVEPKIKARQLPRCDCGGLLRPAVVWFGEVPLYLTEINGFLKECDLLLVVGTSSTVYPAAGFANQVAQANGKVAVFNLDKSEGDEFSDYLFRGSAAETLPKALGLEKEAEELMEKNKFTKPGPRAE